mgnify:CR=1 FL=1
MAMIHDAKAALLHLVHLLESNPDPADIRRHYDLITEVFYANQHLYEKLTDLKAELSNPESKIYRESVETYQGLHVDGLVKHVLTNYFDFRAHKHLM